MASDLAGKVQNNTGDLNDVVRFTVKQFMSRYFWHLIIGWTAMVFGSYFVIDEWQKRRNTNLEDDKKKD